MFLPAILPFLVAAHALDLSGLDSATLEALSAEGPVVALTLDAEGRPGMSTAVTSIDAPCERVQAIMEGFGDYPAWMPQVMEASVVEAGAQESIVAFRLGFDFFVTIKVDYTLRYRRTDTWRVEFEQLEGDMARNEGFWELQPHGEGCFLSYGSFADYRSLRLLRGVLEAQPALELGMGSSSAAVVAQAVKERAEGVVSRK